MRTTRPTHKLPERRRFNLRCPHQENRRRRKTNASPTRVQIWVPARRVPHTHSNYDANRRFKLRRPHHRYHTHKNLPKRRRTRVQFWLLAPLLRHTQIDDSSHEGSNCNAQPRVPRTTKNASPMRVQIPAPTLSVPTTKADFTPDLSEQLTIDP